MIEHRTHRRGSEALEFALTLPFLLVILGGIIDFGWFATHQSGVYAAASYGARAGSRTPQDLNPVATATLSAKRDLADSHLANATVHAAMITLPTGEQAIEVEVEAPYSGIWGFIPFPIDYQGHAVRRMDEQPES